MGMNEKTLYQVRYLLSRSLDGSITEEEIQFLDKRIVEDPQARQYYVEYLQIHTHLRKLLQHDPACIQYDRDTILDTQLWKQLARHEQTAELIAIERQKPQPQPQQNPQPVVRKTKVSRLSIIGVAASIAAMLFIVVYAYLFASPVVATLTDSVDAKWAHSQMPLQIGDRIPTKMRDLLTGFVSFRFDSGAEVVVEGPAQFKPISESKLRITSGKVFAHVPNTAIGFVIDSPVSTVVDLGTEFGLEVFPGGDSEVHVIQGKVNLVAGRQGTPQVSEILRQTEARRVDAGSTQIRPAEFKSHYFVRKISSKEKVVWNGEPVSLADIAGGGDGFGPGRQTGGIDPGSGVIHRQVEQAYGRSGSGTYHMVPQHPCVDGVFVPSANPEPVVVSSAGHTFDGFPQTSNDYWADITTQPVIQQSHLNENQEIINTEFLHVSLDSSPVVRPSEKPLLVIHSNAGITFDLNEIRHRLAGQEISVRFTARCGVSSNVPTSMRQEFWVLVDGQQRFHSVSEKTNSAIQTIDVEIQPQQRFLTLAATDGGDGVSFDWCIFEDPKLELKSK